MTPETRPPAPGGLRVLQEFMNSAHLGGRAMVSPSAAEAIRTRREAGESQATLAVEFGLSQGFVAAIGRGARLGDDLETPASARDWLLARDLLDPGGALDDEDMQRLRELRELLRALALANNGQPLPPEVLPLLDQAAKRAPLVFSFEGGCEPSLRPSVAGIDGATARVLALLYEAMRDGSFQRLKRCQGDGCPHTFYDASRNRTGTWCAMSVCGNRTKVRSYQSRRRAARSTG